MKAGDRITVHGPKNFADDATVETICHPDELPAIANAPNVAAVRAILAERPYVNVALITYKFLDETLAFVALEDPRGQWWDLKGTPLIIEQRPAENELDRLLKNQQTRRADSMRIVSRGRAGIDWRKF